LHGPFVVLLEQDCADEPDDGVLIGEDADDLGALLDLAIDAFERVGRVQLGAVCGREGHAGEDVGLGPGRGGGAIKQDANLGWASAQRAS